MRRQSLRIFGRREVEPEWRAGPDQHEAHKDSKWKGRIFDPNAGSTNDSTIALRGAGSLRVEGCAFGGMFCGGQTWSRLS
jgi:uncharacterized protein (DUF2147 family)